MGMTIYNNFKGHQSIKVPGKNPIILAKPKDAYTFESLKEYIPYRKAILSRIATGHLTWKSKFPEDDQAPVHGMDTGSEADKEVVVPAKPHTKPHMTKPNLQVAPDPEEDENKEVNEPESTEDDTGSESESEGAGEETTTEETAAPETEPKPAAKQAKKKTKTTSAKPTGKKKVSKKAPAKKAPAAAPKGSLEQLNSILASKVDELKSTPRENMEKRTQLKKEMKAVKSQIAKLQAG